jgi:hypothetical protein
MFGTQGAQCRGHGKALRTGFFAAAARNAFVCQQTRRQGFEQLRVAAQRGHKLMFGFGRKLFLAGSKKNGTDIKTASAEDAVPGGMGV